MLIVPSSPIFAYIEATSGCNNRCSGCGNVFEAGSEAAIHIDVWKTVLPKLKPSVAHLNITGGEPTLSPDFSELISLVNELNFSFSLFTNARWKSKDQITDVLGGSPNFAELLVSLHGPDAASHDRFTGIPGSFKETCQNIHFVVNHNLSVFLNCVITSLNFDRVDEMLRLACQLGSRGLIYSRFVHLPDGCCVPSDHQLAAAIEAIGNQANNADIPIFSSVSVPTCFQDSTLFNGCLAGTVSLTIDPWGNVRPCVMSPLICGNLNENSLHDVWHSEKMRFWRNYIPSFCTRCSAYSTCHGGCRAAAMVSGQHIDPLVRSPLNMEQHIESAAIDIPINAKPLKCFTMRSESFGYILIRASQVVPVRREAKDVLDLCDGTVDMLGIRERFGQAGIDLVAQLHRQGLMRFQC